MTPAQIKALSDFIFNTEACNVKLTEAIALLEALGLQLVITKNKSLDEIMKYENEGPSRADPEVYKGKKK